MTAYGLVQDVGLSASVLPFILRNVTLAGIDSVNAPQEARILSAFVCCSRALVWMFAPNLLICPFGSGRRFRNQLPCTYCACGH